MWFGLITLFPEMFASMKEYGVLGRAVSSGVIEIESWNPRDYTLDKHRTVDDRPYGGGPGMLMKVQPLEDALSRAKRRASDKVGVDHAGAKVIYLSPQGQKLDHELAASLAKETALIFISGRYEGIDERLIESQVDLEISIGDYVLSGGELASMVLIDAIARLVPGVLGHEESAKEDSFATGLLDCPHYTRPEVIDGVSVPEVLMSGNHERIRKWRLQQALGRTYIRRPDLLQGKELSEEQKQLLAEYLKDVDR